MKQSGASSTKQEEADMPAKYLKIANKLQEDIFQGLYNETGFLPTELEIAASNNVSRQTARNALAVLVSNGLIERRQGSGSRIVKQKKNPKSNSVAVVTSKCVKRYTAQSKQKKLCCLCVCDTKQS